MRVHRLRREIIATVVANQLVDRAGTTFVFRLSEETGGSPALLARAYAAAREIQEDDLRVVEGEVETAHCVPDRPIPQPSAPTAGCP